MKELQKYFVHPSDIHAHANRFGGDKEIYLASEADAAFADMRREHAEEIERLQSVFKSVMDFNSGEIEGLTRQAERYEKLRRLSAHEVYCLFDKHLDLYDPSIAAFDSLVDQLPASGEEKT